jgi:hypothetical protein
MTVSTRHIARDISLPAAWRETLAAVAVVVVGLVAFAFVLLILPWVISI